MLSRTKRIRPNRRKMTDSVFFVFFFFFNSRIRLPLILEGQSRLDGVCLK